MTIKSGKQGTRTKSNTRRKTYVHQARGPVDHSRCNISTMAKPPEQSNKQTPNQKFNKPKANGTGVRKKQSQNKRKSNSTKLITENPTNKVCRNSKGQFVSKRRKNHNNTAQHHSHGYTVTQKRLIKTIAKNGTAESRRKELFVAKNLPITGGTVKRQEQIISAVSDNFTTSEIQTMVRKNRPVVKVKRNDNGADASHRRKFQGERKPACIIISNDADETAIVHEFVHHSRSVDQSRKNISKTVYPQNRNGRTSRKHYGNSGEAQKLSNAEECATTAETTVRVKKETNRPAAYFDRLGKRDPYTGQYKATRSENYRSDRRTLRRRVNGSSVPDGKTVKGINAVKMFIRNYPYTRISKRKMGDETAEETSRKMTREDKR